MFRSLMAAGKGKNWKTATENSASSSTRPTEESPRRWDTNKGESQRVSGSMAQIVLGHRSCLPDALVSHVIRPAKYKYATGY